jgi:hypothetical protein
MRTKVLLLIAAAAAAGIVASNAQVYSVNAVGYVNKTIPKGGFALLANPLDAGTNNTVAALFGGHDGLQVFVWDTATKSFKFTAFSTDFGWDPAPIANTIIPPGSGVFVKNPTTADIQVTFVGEVMQGKDPNPLTTPLVAGLQIVSSKVPQAGTPDALGYKADDGDAIYEWNLAGQQYSFSQFSTDFGWDPALKPLDVGDAFFLSKTKAGTWTRSFDVNATQ